MTTADDSGIWDVLVADDDDDWRQLVAMSLRRAGFNVSEACDGEELVDRYRALSILTDNHLVVISDFAMPGCDGISATRLVRSVSEEVPIVLVTGERSPELLQAARAAGVTRIVSKPVACTALLASLREVMRDAQQ